jgi:hypothetical protein
MRLTNKQKENLSKSLFDVGKLILAVVVLGEIASGPVNYFRINMGLVSTVSCFVIATLLDRGE